MCQLSHLTSRMDESRWQRRQKKWANLFIKLLLFVVIGLLLRRVTIKNRFCTSYHVSKELRLKEYNKEHHHLLKIV